MKTQRRSLISALLAVAITCIALAGALFVAPTFKTVLAVDNTEISIDFEQSTDANYFRSGTSSKSWGISNGTYKPNNTYSAAYYKEPLTIPTTGTLYISFDYYASSCLSMGLTNSNVVEDNINSDGSPTSALGTALSGAGAGLYASLGSAPGNKGWLESSMNLQGWIYNSVDLSSYLGAVHRMGIVCVDGAITFEIDGKTIYNATQTAKATLTETVYLTFHARTLNDYIDNLTIENDFDSKYNISTSDKDFSLLDKKGSISGHGGNKTFFGSNVDISSLSGGYERRNLYNAGYNFFGADYYTFKVDNQTGNYVSFGLDITEGKSNYGAWWTAAENMPYYLEYEDGTVKQGIIKQYNLNRGVMMVPTDFNGTLVFPLTSAERMSWSVNEDRVANWTKDSSAINLSNLSWIDVYYYETASCKDGGYLYVSNEQIWGDYIAGVANSANRVINAINNIGNVTLASESQIAFAREMYDALADKTAIADSYVTTLTNAETAYAELSDCSYMVGADGKNFEGTGGVSFGETFASSPSTLSAWVKVARSTADDTHVGTVMGNMERIMSSSNLYDSTNSFSFEITTNGNPKLIWRKSRTAKTVFLVENVDVRTGSYVNVTFVRDTAKLQLACYINGTLVATQSATEDQIKDLTFANFPRYVMVGNDYRDDEILAYGYHPDFAGYIADVSVYSTALTANQIVDNMSGIRADGLLGAIDFASGETGEYYDEVNANAFDTYGWKEVSDISELNLGEYSMAVLGDTQMLLSCAKDSTGKDLFRDGYNHNDNAFKTNTTWLAENADEIGLKFVMHVGDITDNLNYDDKWQKQGMIEMAYSLDYMDILTDAGIPWSLSRGNHDGGGTAARIKYFDGGSYVDGVWTPTDITYSLYSANGASGTASGSYSRHGYSGAEYGENSQRMNGLLSSGALTGFGTQDENMMRNTYYKFTAGEVKWLVLALDLEPTDTDIAWAKTVIEANTDSRIIITTHAYLGSTGNLMTTNMMTASGHNSGKNLWDKLVSKYSNIAMVLCGHSSGEDIVTTKLVGDNGNVVWNVMIDESAHEFIGKEQWAPIAILGFSDNGNTVNFNYYSTVANKLFRSANQFSIDLSEVVVEEEPEEETDTMNWPDATDTRQIVLKPNIQPFSVYSAGAGLRNNTVGDSTTLQIAYNGVQFRDYWKAYAVSIDIGADGVYKFDSDAYLKATKLMVAVLQTSAKDGLTRIVELTDPDTTDTISFANGMYGPLATGGSVYMTDILPNGINVCAGDQITVLFSGSTSYWGKMLLDGAVYNAQGVEIEDHDLNMTSATIANNLYKAGYNGKMADGTTSSYKNYKGFTAGWLHLTGSFANFFTQYTNTITVKDESGNTLFTAVSPALGAMVGTQSKLPTLIADGYKFIGYIADNKQYAGDEYSVWGTSSTSGTTQTVTALFEKLPEIITIYDTDGKEAVVLPGTFTGELPVLTRSGRVFLGYLVNGELVKTHNYTGEEESVKAVFAKFSTYNGASMRISEPAGLRFRTFIDTSVLTAIGAENFAFGTIVAHADDILVNGAYDYSKLVIDTEVQHLNIVSTEEGQGSIGNYTYFNGALVSIKANHYDWKWAGVGYMTVTYADGSTQTFYAGVNDNARSVAEIAKNAYDEVRLVRTNTFSIAVEGGYSMYDQTTLNELAVFFGGAN